MSKEEVELDFLIKEDGQEYAQVTLMVENGGCEAMCIDGVKRLCHIPGKIDKISIGDIILIGLRDNQDEADVILKYTLRGAGLLKGYGELPEDIKLNEKA